MLELAGKIPAGRVAGKGTGRAHVWGGCLLGPGAHGWNLSVPVRKFKPDPIFSFPYKFEGGLWEEVFLCCVSTAWLLLLPRAVLWTACPSPWWSCGSGQQEYWLFLQQTDEGFDLSSFQLELNIPNLSVAVKRIVLWISELLEAVWIIAVKSMPNSGVINSYIMYPTSLGSQDVTWKEIKPHAIPALPEDHCVFRGWCPLSQDHCGQGRFVPDVSVPSRDLWRHLSASFPFLSLSLMSSSGRVQTKNTAHVRLVGTIICFCVCRNFQLLCNYGCHMK